MKITFEPLGKDFERGVPRSKGTPDAEFLAAFAEKVSAVAAQPLPEGVPVEPPPEFAEGARRLKISASMNSPILISHELMKDQGGIEACLLESASRNVGRVLQRHGMTGEVTEIVIVRSDLAEVSEVSLIATVEFSRNPAAPASFQPSALS